MDRFFAVRSPLKHRSMMTTKHACVGKIEGNIFLIFHDVDVCYQAVLATKVFVVITTLVTFLADPDLAHGLPPVLLLLRTSSILLYSVPALIVFLLTALLSLYVTLKVRKVAGWKRLLCVTVAYLGIQRQGSHSSQCDCRRRAWTRKADEEQQQEILQVSSYKQLRREVCLQVWLRLSKEKYLSQVYQGGDQVRTEDKHAGSPSFLADHPSGCSHALVPWSTSS